MGTAKPTKWSNKYPLFSDRHRRCRRRRRLRRSRRRRRRRARRRLDSISLETGGGQKKKDRQKGFRTLFYFSIKRERILWGSLSLFTLADERREIVRERDWVINGQIASVFNPQKSSSRSCAENVDKKQFRLVL